MHINYPHYDGIWIAVDGASNVAALITAAAGPIPKTVLVRSSISIESMEARLCELPRFTACVPVACDPSFQGAAEIAERGLFVYDWSDVHRTLRQALGAYELIAKPTVPIRASDLPPDLRSTAHLAQLREIDFAAGTLIDVRACFDCLSPQR